MSDEQPDRIEPAAWDEDEEGLRIIAREDPPVSGANDFIIVGACIATVVGAIAFGVGMLVGWPIEVFGGGLALALFGLGLAVRRWVIDRFPDVDAIEERPFEADDEGPISAVPTVPRRTFLGRLVAGAGGVFGLSLLVPVVSLGPAPGEALRRTAWQDGTRLVTGENRPVTPDTLAVGGVITVWPAGATVDEMASVVLMRLTHPPSEPTNLDWVVEDSIVAYSKVCTHAGCPVGLFRAADDALYCPCHQAQFDVARGAAPTFGPASRPLPQLPLGVGEDGYLVALGDFEQPVGPPRGA
jgi:ubiquinol-cytochrome c reductase iron-sulfur subunit